MISIIKQRKIWFVISGLLVVSSLVVIFAWGLRLGIDFTGGSILEIEFSQQSPTNTEIITALQSLTIGTVTVQQSEASVLIRFAAADEETHQKILNTLSDTFANQGQNAITEKRFDSIGPSIGAELKEKTIWGMTIVVIAIIIYISWAFRKVSQPVSSWKYGLIAVVALTHDVIITTGVFAVLGVVYGVEINAPFVAAILTILGYSVNDTIVVFDRTRENLKRHFGKDFGDVVDESIQQVITRSINASVTTLAVLLAILLLGGSTVRDFVLALIIGISIGTYSSIFVASPLLVTWHRFKNKPTN